MLPCIILYYTLFTVYVEERLEFSHILYTPQKCDDNTLRPEQFHFDIGQVTNGTTSSGSFRVGDDVAEPVKLSSAEWELIGEIPTTSYSKVKIVKRCVYFQDNRRTCQMDIREK